MMQQDDKEPAPARKVRMQPDGANEGEFAIIEASTLFGRSREIGISHEGALYRLKITRQGKLILNK